MNSFDYLKAKSMNSFELKATPDAIGPPRNLYIEIDSILNRYPLLNDRWTHIASYYDTKFIR